MGHVAATGSQYVRRVCERWSERETLWKVPCRLVSVQFYSDFGWTSLVDQPVDHIVKSNLLLWSGVLYISRPYTNKNLNYGRRKYNEEFLEHGIPI